MDRRFSPNFHGVIGQQFSVENFPFSNIVTDKSKYVSDCNWAFCRFDDDEIVGARFGITRGFLGSTDYGFAADKPEDSCELRVEVVTRDGAYLWIEDTKYKAADITIPPNEYQHALFDHGEEILHLSGWPVITWKMSSSDGSLKIAATLQPKSLFILPDSLLRSSRFSMWIAVCSISCVITIDGKQKEVQGTAFYDHPRIIRERNSVPEFGSYNYLPVWFNDGSYFVSYYSEIVDGTRNDNYTFGYSIDSSGSFREFQPDGIQSITFDEDDQLKTCASRWRCGQTTLSIAVTAEPIGVKRVWGSRNVPKTRKDNRVFPLPFNCVATIDDGAVRREIQGVGLNEYIQNPKR